MMSGGLGQPAESVGLDGDRRNRSVDGDGRVLEGRSLPFQFDPEDPLEGDRLALELLVGGGRLDELACDPGQFGDVFPGIAPGVDEPPGPSTFRAAASDRSIDRSTSLLMSRTTSRRSRSRRRSRQ